MSLSFTPLKSGLFLVQRRHKVLKAGFGHDITGPYSMVIKLEILSGSIEWLVDGKLISPMQKKVWLYVPPHSWAAEYNELGTDLKLEGLVVTEAPPFSCKQPVLFYSTKEVPRSITELKSLEKSIEWGASVSVCSSPGGLAVKVKRELDENFSSGIQIQQIAKKFKTSEAVISRQFKESFGFTPASYRRGLKSTTAMYDLLAGASIVDAAAAAGYTDLGRFYKEFGKYIKATPGEFTAKKSKNAKKSS